MGRALFTGLVKSKKVLPSDFILTNHHVEKLSDLKKKYGVAISNDNQKAVRDADVIVLCVRPRMMKQVVHEIRNEISTTKLAISVAACVPIQLLESYFQSDKMGLIRIIPNIPVSFQKGVIGWIDNGKVTKADINVFTSFFQTLGLLLKCKNDEGLEKLSMIAGCGIGYVAYFMKNLSLAAEKYGFSTKDAQRISQLVFSSTIEQLERINQTPDKLVTAVATKGGITEEVLMSLDKGAFPELFQKSIQNGFQKVKNISDELQKEI